MLRKMLVIATLCAAGLVLCSSGDRAQCSAASTKTDVDLVVVSVAELGLGVESASPTNIYLRAKELGLGLAPAEVGPESEEYPGPWREVTQEVRDFLALHKVYACNQVVGRQSSHNSGEYLLYCTRDEKHWTSWRVQPATHKLRGPDKLIEGIPLPDSY